MINYLKIKRLKFLGKNRLPLFKILIFLMYTGPLWSVQKSYLVIQRPSRQVVYFTGTQYLPKEFNHGTNSEFVPRGPQGITTR